MRVPIPVPRDGHTDVSGRSEDHHRILGETRYLCWLFGPPGTRSLGALAARLLGRTRARSPNPRTTDRRTFDAGAANYQWLHRALFLAEGRLDRGWIEYQVYRVT